MHDQSNNQPFQIPEDVRAFLEGILQDAGMVALDEGMRDEMIKELFLRLDDFMLTTIVDNLPSDKLEAFTKMSEEGKTREELEKYLQDNIPDIQTKFGDAMLEFRNLYLGNVAVARNAPPQNPAPAPSEQQPTDDTDGSKN